MEEKIIKVIKDTVWLDDAPNIKLSSRLKEDLNLDSLDLVEIAMRIEKKFNIDIPDKEFERWHEILDIINTVKILIQPSF